MIEAMGLRRPEVYIANVVNAGPPENRQPEKDETATCSPFLLRQIDAIAPKVMVCLGSTAAQFILATPQSISRFRSETVRLPPARAFLATYHPAILVIPTPRAMSGRTCRSDGHARPQAQTAIRLRRASRMPSGCHPALVVRDLAVSEAIRRRGSLFGFAAAVLWASLTLSRAPSLAALARFAPLFISSGGLPAALRLFSKCRAASAGYLRRRVVAGNPGPGARSPARSTRLLWCLLLFAHPRQALHCHPHCRQLSALTLVLSMLSGEAVRWENILGIVISLAGVVLAATAFDFADHRLDPPASSDASAHAHRTHVTSGVSWAAGAACAFGVMFWLIGYHVMPVLGGVASVWIIRLSTMVALTVVPYPRADRSPFPAAASSGSFP